MANRELIDKLNKEHVLSLEEWEQIFATWDAYDLQYAARIAQCIALERFGRRIYFRGIVEFTNICRNDCYYCGIRCGNADVKRYRLSEEEIMECCEDGYEHGFRTFVLQGGEDPYFDRDRMCGIVRTIAERFPDCAVTLSIGELDREFYEALYEAGARRYLLRHETADEDHYRVLHPEGQTLANRMRCLRDLKDIGYQTGCGIMVGTPRQTARCLAKDMVFMGGFKPEMIGIGPFIPHSGTPFRDEPGGSVDASLLVIALCRIMLPDALIPSTTALGTAGEGGRQKGVLAGCNVVMPNLSPLSVRKQYMLYDNKSGTDMSAEAGIALLRKQMEEIGYEVVVGRGDFQARS